MELQEVWIGTVYGRSVNRYFLFSPCGQMKSLKYKISHVSNMLIWRTQYYHWIIALYAANPIKQVITNYRNRCNILSSCAAVTRQQCKSIKCLIGCVEFATRTSAGTLEQYAYQAISHSRLSVRPTICAPRTFFSTLTRYQFFFTLLYITNSEIRNLVSIQSTQRISSCRLRCREYNDTRVDDQLLLTYVF